MKRFSQPFPRGRILPVALVLLALVPVLSSHAITLTGSNGRAVEFAGIKDATPKGITAQMTAESPLIGIPWDKIDLTALQKEHPGIHAAYLATQRGETVALNLGSYDTKPKMANPATGLPKRDRFPGWIDTEVAGGTWALQLPAGTPRAILFVSAGGMGRSLQYFTGFDIGSGPFGELQTKDQVAILAYQFDYRDRNPRNMPDFAYADKGTGQHLMEALAKISAKASRPELLDLPILVYGSERIGATMAYSFVHWKPEVVLGAVLVKGAFYSAEPTEETAAIPMMFIWGEYSNEHEIWGTEDTAQAVLAKAAPLAPNWTSGREFRGGAELNRETEYFALEYLREILQLRLREDGAEPAEEEEPEDAAEGDDAEGDDADAEPAAAEESGPASRILPLDRSAGYIGVHETNEYSKIDDVEAAHGEGESYIPTLDMARMWKRFGDGTLEAPAPR